MLTSRVNPLALERIWQMQNAWGVDTFPVSWWTKDAKFLMQGSKAWPGSSNMTASAQLLFATRILEKARSHLPHRTAPNHRTTPICADKRRKPLLIRSYSCPWNAYRNAGETHVGGQVRDRCPRCGAARKHYRTSQAT